MVAAEYLHQSGTIKFAFDSPEFQLLAECVRRPPEQKNGIRKLRWCRVEKTRYVVPFRLVA